MTDYFEDIADGLVMSSGYRTVTRADIEDFARLSGDRQALHLDDNAARAAGYGACIAHGALIYSLAAGLQHELEDWALIGIVSTRRSFLAAVEAGQSIRVTSTVRSRRPSRSNPGRGLIKLGVEVVNDLGQVVQRGDDTLLMSRRPAHPS